MEHFFITYGSAVLLFFGLLGYFIKRIYDLKSKKLEINHTLFQQNRIIAVTNFLASYAKTELMWRDIAVYKIFSNQLTASEMDNIIWPPMYEMKRSVLELKIYFEEDNHLKFQNLLEGFLAINNKLMQLYFLQNSKETELQKSNKFHSVKNKMFIENEKLLDNVCEEIREFYKS